MGERKRRLSRFKLAHPVCCICGGEAATETIDHIPPKVIFIGSQLPAACNIEYPACTACNSNSSQYDQICAMIGLTSPREPSNTERKHFIKVLHGAQNNAGSTIGEINRGYAGWRHLGRKFTENTGIEAHASELGPNNRKAIFVLTAKLALAHFYWETGRILTPNGAVVVDMITNVKLFQNEIPDNYKLSTKFRTLSKHDKQEQFLFRHILSENEDVGIFQFVLHLNLMLVAMVMEDRNRHPIELQNERTFIPGFLTTLTKPSMAFSTGASFRVAD
jgi:hypothetical protein